MINYVKKTSETNKNIKTTVMMDFKSTVILHTIQIIIYYIRLDYTS